MTISEYQSLAARTMNRLCDNLVAAGLGVAGEAGEVADLIKKVRCQGHDLESVRGKLLEEAGDLAWYIALLCTALGESMEDVLRDNIQKLRARYPDGFDPERSIHREKTAP